MTKEKETRQPEQGKWPEKQNRSLARKCVAYALM